MDHTTPKYYQPPSLFASQGESVQEKTKGNPFEEGLICNLNLKETGEFVKALPMSYGSELAQKRREKHNVVWNSVARKMESPSTPGRPVFSFSTVSRRNVPSKWDDAEKWLFSGGSSCHESPAHHAFHSEVPKASNSKSLTRENGFKQQQQPQSPEFSDKFRVVDCQIRSSVSSLEDQHVPLKDKFTDDKGLLNPKSRYSSEPTKEGFFFKTQKLENEPMKSACTEVIIQQLEEVKHRDIGTEMTPLGSSTTSRCHTPFMSTSPARHNTPASRSGPLAQSSPIEITKQLHECHLAKLQVGSAQFDSGATHWSSREEEEEEISKSLRHFEIGRMSVSISEPRACAWEEEAKSKSCLRYQREEAKIQAWVNLQTAKAEAQSKKLEVKIQKMKSELEEKVMKRMRIVDRKAEEWRAAAQFEHSDQIRKASQHQHAQKQKEEHIFKHKHYLSHTSNHYFISCACFPCTTN